MKLSITSRLTITTALLTLFFFLAAGAALYLSVASGIRTENIRSTESAARSLAFNALYQWDQDLMVEYKGGEDPLKTLNLQAPHWALARGDGRIVESRGDLLSRGFELTNPGACGLLTREGQTFRIASVPLFGSPREEFTQLPECVVEAARQKSPEGVFLRAKRGASKGTSLIEVAMLEPQCVRELEVAYDGAVLDEEVDGVEKVVPPDRIAETVGKTSTEEVVFSSWRAYKSQLIVIVDVKEADGGLRRLAVNRLGERFLLDDEGDILGADPRSRLWIVTATDASAEIQATNRLRATLAFGLPLLWGAVVLVGWYVTRRALSPVNRIVETVQRIEVSRLDERLPVGPVEDELNRISATINKMLDRIKDGYSRERQFTGDASHELRGPLAKIIADIDVALSRERQAEELRETLLRCRSYARGMQRLVDSLLWLARLGAGREALVARPFELTDLAAETVRLFPEAQASRVRLEVPGDKSAIMAHGAPELVRVLLQNLLENALRYSPAESVVALRLSAENGEARIDVEDRGEGIPEDQMERVFSRFFRVDKSRSRETGGFGLGLAIVNEIAQAHGTRVALENLPAGGLRASFFLPVTPRPESRQPAAAKCLVR